MIDIDTTQEAHEILAHLGGALFCETTGAKYCLSGDNAVDFLLPRAAKGGINSVRIESARFGTYTIIFDKINRRTQAARNIVTTWGVHADYLREVFARHTGI